MVEKRLVTFLRTIEDQLHPHLVFGKNHRVVYAGEAGTGIEPVASARLRPRRPSPFQVHRLDGSVSVRRQVLRGWVRKAFVPEASG